MPVFIDSDTGFPSEIPCSGCGWPLYCCLCSSEDDESEEAVEHGVHLTGGESAEQVRTENELSEWGNPSRPPTSK